MTKNILSKTEKLQLVDKVNYILDTAFRLNKSSGRKRIRGYFSPGGLPKNKNTLGEIYEVYYNLRPDLGEFIGRFTNEDGSSLEVNPEYSSQTQRYAELYKKEFGKDVKVDLIS